MGSRWILAVNSCLLVFSGCGIGRSTVSPEFYGQFRKTGPIILDTVTGMEWQVGPDRSMTWDEAKDWVESLGENWRMPTRTELQGLWDAGVSDCNWGPFMNSGWWVWSGDVTDSSSAWPFAFYRGYENWNYRSTSHDTRAFAVSPR